MSKQQINRHVNDLPNGSTSVVEFEYSEYENTTYLSVEIYDNTGDMVLYKSVEISGNHCE